MRSHHLSNPNSTPCRSLDLAYFDKSMRRPSYLHESASEPIGFSQASSFADHADPPRTESDLERPPSELTIGASDQLGQLSTSGSLGVPRDATPSTPREGDTTSERAYLEDVVELQVSNSSDLTDRLGQLIEQVASAPIDIRPETLRQPSALWARLWRVSLLLLAARLLLGLADSISSWLISLLTFGPG